MPLDKRTQLLECCNFTKKEQKAPQEKWKNFDHVYTKCIPNRALISKKNKHKATKQNQTKRNT